MFGVREIASSVYLDQSRVGRALQTTVPPQLLSEMDTGVAQSFVLGPPLFSLSTTQCTRRGRIAVRSQIPSVRQRRSDLPCREDRQLLVGSVLDVAGCTHAVCEWILYHYPAQYPD